MCRRNSQLLVVVTICLWMMSLAGAQAMATDYARRRAPAPLLAAGIPAFVAVGGGAVIGRIIRRRRRDD